ncbi:hypothetical protein KDN34_13310 [Shewanella yunxiaonensis]|uniref:YbaK/aminoacyl-tRNA synthetase-associated domain-containing protein n=1 Tax=Shewanella yunxiaonensis TaxID=2829809 RepID=A0ABX7YST0_9GAMM|nr:YbaK/EbsC family protein [Shewanella yunxiaonensis]QUN05171.1 hypothetical protein KDN34_13310 [Shewanella yunxiaonensis]
MTLATQDIFQQLQQTLLQANARFRVVEHPTAGKCEQVAAIRGTALGQGAKALLCHLKGNGVKQHVLAVLPADCQAELAILATAFGARKASLASPVEMQQFTGCVAGAIPPFSFHPALILIADPYLFQRYEEIAFNAGTLERSIILNVEDYLRIAAPRQLSFIRRSS